MDMQEFRKIIKNYGFIENFGDASDGFVRMGSPQDARIDELDICDEVEYFNGAGYSQFPNGDKVSKETAKFIRFRTNRNESGDTIFCWLEKKAQSKKSQFKIYWGVESDFKKRVQYYNSFKIGRMYFDKEEDGLSFLEEINKVAIPEPWCYASKTSKINYPILKSYLENILEKLSKEKNATERATLVYNEDGEKVAFNTNLLDRFFHEVVIIAKNVTICGETYLYKPYKARDPKYELRKLNFKQDEPLAPQFFEDISEVLFHTEWDISRDYGHYQHIIEERKERLNMGDNIDVGQVSRKLDNAIKYAVSLAKRNYKFIVPMYRPQTNQIQFLMPIYLNEEYAKRPDFALVLQTEKDIKMYTPKTILPLDAAYQNARLIAKPDDAWLNPGNIVPDGSNDEAM